MRTNTTTNLTPLQELFLRLQADGRRRAEPLEPVAEPVVEVELDLDFAMLDAARAQRLAGVAPKPRKRWMGPHRPTCCAIISQRNESERERRDAAAINRLNMIAGRFPVGCAVFWDGLSAGEL